MTINATTDPQLERREALSKPLGIYERMVEIRLVEERIQGLYEQGHLRGSTHLCSGQEAVCVGVARFTDTVSCTCRSQPWCAVRSCSEVAAALDAHGSLWSPYGSAADVVGSPTGAAAGGASPANGPVVRPEVQRGAAAGGVLVNDVGLAYRFAGEASRPLGAAPTLGRDTESVLSELLGLSQHEIGRPHDEGLVEGPALGAGVGNV